MQVLSRALGRVLGAYAIYFNGKSGRVGHLFQDRFTSEPVNDDAYLISVIRYIHHNPVKAGISTVDAYPWSSYSEYIGDPVWCATELPLSVFGGVEEFVRAHAAESSDECLDIPSERRGARTLSTERAVELANTVLAPMRIGLEDIKGLDVAKRNRVLAALKRSGLTVRQVERLTGIGRNTVQRAK